MATDMFVTMDNLGMFSGNNTWQGLYIRIRGTNAALDYLDDVTGTVEEKAIVGLRLTLCVLSIILIS